MTRVSPEQIVQVQRDVPLVATLQAAGVALAPDGDHLRGQCPFHADESGSLSVDTNTQRWRCEGECQCEGGIIEWVMRAEGVSLRHAVELLQRGYQPVPLDLAPARNSSIRKLPLPFAIDVQDAELLMHVVEYYHQTLLQSQVALAYLKKRGIADDGAIRTFRLGFANRTLGYRLPESNRVDGADLRGRLQRLGILRDSGHEHFNGSLTIPVISAGGQVVQIYGRKITSGLTKGTARHLYLPGGYRGVWNESALSSNSEVILCDGLINALTFWCAGYRNVTCVYGLEALTDEYRSAFKRAGVKRLLIAFARTDAAERAILQWLPIVLADGLECYRIQFPKGMDANEYSTKVTPANRALGITIRKAVWLGKEAAPAEGPGDHVPDALEAVGPAPEALEPPATNLTSVAEDQRTRQHSENVAPVALHPADVSGDEVRMSFGDRLYRVRGLAKNLSYETLRVNVLLTREGRYYVDTLDLYSARQRHQYILHAAKEVAVRDETLKIDVGRILLKLESLQQERIEQALKVEPQTPAMSEEERAQAHTLLEDPHLLDRIVDDFAACGVVGERTNKLVAYLAAVSRKLDRPLAVLVQSSSAAGKTNLMDAVLAFMPPEERVKYSAMTGQSLFYMGERHLKHKILAIAEEEGVTRASYALKLLQSEGELTIASTGKHPQTGELIAQEYRVEGPVMIMFTTTAISIDEELLNRCLVLSVDEGREQTEAIHRLQRQRRTLAGLAVKRRKQQILAQHQNAQRLLKAVCVVNPFADELTFLSDKTRTRRDHEKYLTLIDTVALLHQFQRSLKTASSGDGGTLEYIEVTMEDVARANGLAHEVLGRSLDELPPQTRRLLASLCTWVAARCHTLALERSEVHFSRRDVREHAGLSDTQLRVHLDRLVELEYLLVHRGMRGQSFVYELLFDGEASAQAPHLSGLIDLGTATSSRPPTPPFAEPTRRHDAVDADTARQPLPEKTSTETQRCAEIGSARQELHVAKNPEPAARADVAADRT